jgi:DNA excision repair protein ERCC-2
MSFCNVIIYSYHYLLDPKIAERVSQELSKDCIVVFDEAHNIDNVCIESLSTDITEDSLRKATRGAQNLENRIAEMKDSDADKLKNEYAKLVEGLREADEAREEDAFMSNPGESESAVIPLITNALAALPDDLLKEAVPGNIRRAEHFVAFLKRFIEYLKVRVTLGIAEKPLTIIDSDEGPPSHLRDPSIIPCTS